MSKQSYSDDNFWDKVETSAKDAGREALRPAFQLYYAQADDKTPLWAKALIWSALVYFIIPFDGAPDPIYIDDIGVMGTALATVAAYITPAIKRKATIALKKWLG